MERVDDATATPEIFENDIDLHLQLFCERDGIDDMRQQSQNVWTSALRYIYKHVFAGGILKQRRLTDSSSAARATTYNAYNYDLVLDVLDIYIFDMCMRYDKEVSIVGFSALTGIDESTINGWGNEGLRLSQTSVAIYQKLRHYREESLSNKLVTGKQNPVGVIAALNHRYGWSSSGCGDASNQKRVSADSELRRLQVSDAQIEDKKQDVVVNCKVTQDIVD